MRMDPKETRWKSVDWINLAQDMGKWQALVNKVINFQVP
jgi:hypothetical protein